MHQLYKYIIENIKMEVAMSLSLKQARKTRKGWLGNKVKQIHLRDDVPCGLQFCHQHANQYVAFNGSNNSETNNNNIIYMIDSDTLIQQTDIIYNCNEMKNVLILQSSIQKLKKKSLNKYNAFKSHLEVQAVGESQNSNEKQTQKQMQQNENENIRNFWVFSDTYHRSINQTLANRLQLKQSYTQQQKQWQNIKCCAEWYQHHIQQLKLNYKMIILTTNNKYVNTNINSKNKNMQTNPNKQGSIQIYIEIQSLIQFLKLTNSNLLDFLGFTGTQNQNQNNMEQQALFQQHLQITEAQKKIKQGKLFQGKYMAQKSYFKIGKNMYKLKLQNNRAMFGDVVAIELDLIQNWQKRGAKSIITQRQDEIQGNIKVQTQLEQQIQNQQSKVNKNIIKLLQQNTHLLPQGKIRAVVKRNIKDYCGSVNTEKVVKSSGQGWAMYEFKPADDRFPEFYIRTYNLKSIQNKRIQVSYDSWPIKSSHPLCHFVRVIGNIGDSRAEGDVILLQHNVQIKQFSRKAYQCLPKQGINYKIPQYQQSYRLDLRSLDVVSIDPPGCKDIDDALHCIQLKNGNLQIGVHIADVSYYVRPDSALDMQARNRCTTVYLVDRRTDMLPKLLTENLCSLRANVDRLAFSTIWEITKEGQIVNTKYCKTIINSKCAFTYMQAQQLMESNANTNIANSIRNLNKIAKLLKHKRQNQGALTLASTQVKITLQQQTHSATDVQLYQMVQANYLIEQFMLLANIAVAQKIYQRFPAISILRRHTAPKIGELEVLKNILALYGYQLNYENSRILADSLDSIAKKDDPFFNKLIRILTTRCMNQATYFCSADYDPQQFYHYGLAAPFYTHFTSPIRRYADVLVHRLLAAAIDLQPLPNFMINKIKMTKICEKMNMRNRMARYASRASSDYHTYQYFKQREKEIQKGIITSISQNSITIMLIKYGLQCKYQLNADDSEKTIKLNKAQGVFNACQIEGKEKKLFQYLDVNIKVEMHGFHKKITINIL